MRALLTASLLSTAFVAIGFAEDAAPGNVVWQGKVAIGAELDDGGIPVDEKSPPAKPSRFRIGLMANWSFAIRWERVESDSESKPKDDAQLTPEESKIIELTNAERKKLKLAELKPDPVLMKLARSHSATMARLDQIGHELEGQSFSKRMDQANYHALRAGENIGAGQRNPAEAVDDWMQSPGHKANIIQADYSRIGIGMATSKSGKTYWTQIFAKPE